MKTRLISLVLLIICFSCGTNNTPLSEAQKEKIIGEVKEIVHTVFKGAEEANFDMVVDTWYDYPDFVYMCNGKTYTYKETMDEMKQFLSVLLNQKCTIVDEKYAVLDNSTVLGTINTTWLMNYKDGHSILQDPWAVQFTFRKIEGRWRVIYHVESGFEKIVKASERPKELNQIELMKQFAGIWKSEKNDTINIIEDNLYGDGHEVFLKTETKGKVIFEGKTLIGYDKMKDILIESELDHNKPDVWLWALRFISTDKFESMSLEDFSHPENLSEKMTYELKSPDLMINTYIKDKKVVSVETYKRVK
jgi:hypothetical protein